MVQLKCIPHYIRLINSQFASPARNSLNQTNIGWDERVNKRRKNEAKKRKKKGRAHFKVKGFHFSISAKCKKSIAEELLSQKRPKDMFVSRNSGANSKSRPCRMLRHYFLQLKEQILENVGLNATKVDIDPKLRANQFHFLLKKI